MSHKWALSGTFPDFVGLTGLFYTQFEALTMVDGPYKHDASDKKLDKAAQEADKSASDSAAQAHQGHDPAHIREHSDTGKDRLFEGREQHDEHDMKSEKNRLAKDLARHEHDEDGSGAVTPANMHVKHKK